MTYLRAIKSAEVTRVVGDKYEVVIDSIAHDVPVHPSGFSDADQMAGFVSLLSSLQHQLDRQTLIDQKPRTVSKGASFLRAV